MFVRQKKQGRGFIRVPVWQDYFAILLFRTDLSRVGEVQIVAPVTIEVDPTLNDTAWRKASAHCQGQRRGTVRRYRYRCRYGNPIVTRGQMSTVINQIHRSAEGVRGKLRLGYTERLVAARWVIQCDVD